jgi:trehalose synthase
LLVIEIVEIRKSTRLAEYSAVALLMRAVRALEEEAVHLVPMLKGRTVWMVNSSAKGGGVAEMLPAMVLLLRQLGLNVQWAVIGANQKRFFDFTKRLHNLIHGSGQAEITREDREVYTAVNRENADALKQQVGPEDILIVHDPQAMALGAYLKQELGLLSIWRCHIGLDEHTAQTRAAWLFLQEFAGSYDHAVFSAPEYIPDYFVGRSSIIHPALDPGSHKNRPLPQHKLTGVLCNAGLAIAHQPVLTPPFSAGAKRLLPNGEFGPATQPEEIGLFYRPIVSQISRWDRLKGFHLLMEGFAKLKQVRGDRKYASTERHRRRLGIVRLVMAGPDPSSIRDDPEGQEVLRELCQLYRDLPADIQSDVALLTLPMSSSKQNALMVNAIQRSSSIVVQNSLAEGFGLTATEAMWKQAAFMGSRACGIRHQVRHGVDGILIRNPTDTDLIAETLNYMLVHPKKRVDWGRNGERHVMEEFLIFTQLCKWLRVLSHELERRQGGGTA